MLVIYGTEFRFKYLRHFTRLTSRCSAEVGYYFMYTEPEWRFKKSVMLKQLALPLYYNGLQRVAQGA
jgi:hypothetical protein